MPALTSISKRSYLLNQVLELVVIGHVKNFLFYKLLLVNRNVRNSLNLICIPFPSMAFTTCISIFSVTL